MYIDINKFFEENKINDFYKLSKLFEIEKHKLFDKSQEEWVFFTKEYVVEWMLNNLKLLKKNNIQILEPSVWSWNFIPHIVKYFSDKYKNIDLYINDIDLISLDFIKKAIELNILKIPNNINIIYINKDYLKDDFSEFWRFDYIIWNPPYWKIQDNEIKKLFVNKKTNNMFSFFIEKSINIGNNISFIVPKSLLFVKQFNENRKLLKSGIYELSDHWKSAFDVNLETISFSYQKIDLLNHNERDNNIIINDVINNEQLIKDKDYVFNDKFPIWLLYRNDDFDKIMSQLNINIFKVFRDRQITNKMLLPKWDYHCLKWKNIGINSILNIEWYDQYVNNLDWLKSADFFNKQNVLCIPNLTNNIRTCLLPENTIVNWAVALLYKHDFSEIKQSTINFINSKEFKEYFYIIKNKSNLSVNIDENIVYFFGDLK